MDPISKNVFSTGVAAGSGVRPSQPTMQAGPVDAMAQGSGPTPGVYSAGAVARAVATAPQPVSYSGAQAASQAAAGVGVNAPAVAMAAGQFSLLEEQPPVQQQAQIPSNMQLANGLQITVDPAEAQALSQQVHGMVADMLSMDPDSKAFKDKIAAVQNMGVADIQRSAGMSNDLLNGSLNSIKAGGQHSSQVAGDLFKLRRELDQLNKDRPVGKLSKIPVIGGVARFFGGKVEDYVSKCTSAQSNLNAIAKNLDAGKKLLETDNKSLKQEVANMEQCTKRVTLFSFGVQLMDSELSKSIEEMKATDPDRAQRFENECLFYVRQKSQDLMTQLAVNMQGQMVLNIAHKNNEELIKGVERCERTTLPAFRTGVLASAALDNQKKVLDAVTGVNELTGNIIANTARQLNEQGKTIREQSSSTTIDPSKLNEAFDQIFQCLDQIDGYKQKGLVDMKQNVDMLGARVTQARDRLASQKREESAGYSNGSRFN
ncbi:MAG TPA: toxic anion resistance protein [Candidatus Xenobia bacterium]|jgi:uncharacterized protein YaaN involved in tellurite resistance